MIKDKYYIKSIDYKTAMAMVVSKHYLHRKSPCSYAFGFFETETNKMIGVITYGKPASPPLCKGICGIEESKSVMELTRLYIDDCTPKNTESWFIGQTIKRVKEEIIVSFADTSAHHLGTIYQATNFIYTGLSDKHVLWEYIGMGNVHARHWAKEYGGVNAAKLALGDDLIRKERPRKHRYIYFNGSKKRKKELKEKLKYIIQPYPKREVIKNVDI